MDKFDPPSQTGNHKACSPCPCGQRLPMGDRLISLANVVIPCATKIILQWMKGPSA